MRRLKTIFCGLLSLILTLSVASPSVLAAVDDTGYSDVAATAWYADSVKYAKDNNLMSGITATTFSPNTPMNRAMLATVLYRAGGSPTVSMSSAFSDMDTNTWYSNALVWASENNIINGYGNGIFGINDPATREQMATILWRYTGSPSANNMSLPFSDIDDISAFAVSPVAWAQENGIMNGKENNLFDPKGNITRAEVASVLHRFLMQINEEPSDPEPIEVPTDENRVLIAYFSRTGENYGVGYIEKGNTEIIAEIIAEQTQGELFQIKTVTPYPDVYRETTDIAQKEKNENARPALIGSIENMSDYDVIYLGYPIWWSDMPMAVYTFLESYDFSGKTIIPFCTHGGGGLGNTLQSIRTACPGAEVISGFSISGETAQNSRDEAQRAVTEWLQGHNTIKRSIGSVSASNATPNE